MDDHLTPAPKNPHPAVPATPLPAPDDGPNPFVRANHGGRLNFPRGVSPRVIAIVSVVVLGGLVFVLLDLLRSHKSNAMFRTVGSSLTTGGAPPSSPASSSKPVA